ncbi:hypothetical protein J2Z83_000204 [Virgibacillus natechei]|uniref:Hydrolase n=1 Tax=Virgibacillus natechei TaxID=1216297 RepID=A0ABS4IB20_9BACI|nr:hypothetical protein [Virgibacillus natechei]MBP1968112.1 hypothetical protein [Virgibacillus natechei]UZD14609.1 hypothetical protein OLD84_08980 [Virgibacillus natechei]
MERQKYYYVTVDTEEIREISIPDNDIEYEITANQNQLEELRELFMKKSKDGKDAAEYIGKPFDEWGADDKREEYQHHLIMIYRKLYELGTEKTKSKIKELGIIH